MGQLKARLPVSRIVMVMNRGTVSDSNLDNLRAGGIGYIASTRLRRLATQEALSVAGRHRVAEQNLHVKEIRCSGVVAYLLERVMGVALAKADLKMTTQQAAEELAQIRMCEVKAGGKRVIGATRLTDRQRAILRALGVPEPPALESLVDIVTN